MPRPIRRVDVLRERLDALVATFDLSHLSPDPLEVVHRYDDPLDQEIVGLIAAAFAYGRAGIVVRNVTTIVEQMPRSPFLYLLEEFDRAEAIERFRGFSHRFHKTDDLLALLGAIAGALRTYGSLGALFHACDDPRQQLSATLSRFVSTLISSSFDPRVSLKYLLTDPADGSACKRMNLYLRWMVRRTSPDLGLWDFIDPARLVVPLDTHVHRIARFLGLHRRKAADWKTAEELTRALARLDPIDPVRYDFAICRLGILSRCSVRRKKENCDVCLLKDVCRIRARSPRLGGTPRKRAAESVQIPGA
jgi:uncharacterized protein (TIGR02757 family)